MRAEILSCGTELLLVTLLIQMQHIWRRIWLRRALTFIMSPKSGIILSASLNCCAWPGNVLS